MSTDRTRRYTVCRNAWPATSGVADPVADALVAAQAAWSGARDSSALRVRLLDLLRLLEASPPAGGAG